MTAIHKLNNLIVVTIVTVAVVATIASHEDKVLLFEPEGPRMAPDQPHGFLGKVSFLRHHIPASRIAPVFAVDEERKSPVVG